MTRVQLRRSMASSSARAKASTSPSSRDSWKKSAPAIMAATASAGGVAAVYARMATSGRRWRSSWMTSSPLRRGMRRSTAATVVCEVALRSASSPSAAVTMAKRG